VISEERWVDYLADRLSPGERERFEQEVAADPEALRRLVDQERMDAALRIVEGQAAQREQLRSSILAAIAESSRAETKDRVMREVGAMIRQSERAEREWAKEQTASRWPKFFWWGLGFACAVLLLLIVTRPPAHRPDERKMSATSATSGELVRRDPVQWPFAPDSPWNTPIGSGAILASVKGNGLDLNSGVMIVNSRVSHPLFVASPTDPETRIFLKGHSRPLFTARLPLAAIEGAGRSSNFHVALDDGATILEFWDGESGGGDIFRVRAMVRFDPRGLGIPPELASANTSGLSPFAGSIRAGELTQGIRHALGAVVPVHAINRRSDGKAHVWPAAWSPPLENSRWGDRISGEGNVQLGSLLALPANLDLGRLDIGTNGPVLEFARALQDYGVYIKDTFDGEYFTDWQRAGRPDLVICAELNSWNELPADLPEKLKRIVRELRVVENNSPESIGGGGKPRRPRAPGF
jgi:hypothetical protein